MSFDHKMKVGVGISILFAMFLLIIGIMLQSITIFIVIFVILFIDIIIAFLGMCGCYLE